MSNKISDDDTLMKYWDYNKNISSHNKFWWKCEKGHSYQREVYNQRKGLAKCPICRKENK